MRFKNLPDVHARRHAQRVQHDINRRPVFEERHVFSRHDAADDTLVPVTAGHLVARLKLALHGNEDLDHLEHAGCEIITALDLFNAVFELRVDPLDGFVILDLHSFEVRLHAVVLNGDLPPFMAFHFAQALSVDCFALLQTLWRGRGDLTDQHFLQARISCAVQDRAFVVTVLGQRFLFFGLNRARTVINVDAVTVEDTDFDDRTSNTRRQTQRGIAHVRRLFTEDGAKELFFRRHRAFALWRDLTDEDIARLNFSTDINDARFVEAAERFFTDVRNVARDVFWPKLGVASHDFKFLDVDRGEDVILHDAFADQDGVFVVVAIPRHERDEAVTAKGQFTQFRRRTIGDDVASSHRIPNLHQRTLVDAGVLVGTLELLKTVDVYAGLVGIDFTGCADNDTGRIDLIDNPRTAGTNGGAGVTGNRFFHTGANERRFGTNERHSLTLHVRSHERAVRVIVFQERNERCGDRNELLGRNVHERDLFTVGDQEFARFPRRNLLFNKAAIGGQLSVRLRDRVLGFFHGRQIDDIAGHLAVDDAAIRRFDEAIFVDAAERGQRVDETDVRAFRRFNRADAAVVRRVNVADFEACTLTCQTAWSKCGHTTLMRHFRQRVGLIHELRQLRRAEEFTDSRHSRLGVDHVVRHHRRNIDRRHTLLNSALHAEQADAILVFQKLTDRADTTVTEVIDIVDFALAVLQIHKGLHNGQNVFVAQRRQIVGRVEAKAHVELHATNRGKVITLIVEEQASKQRFSRFLRRWFARTHDTIDAVERHVAVFSLIDLQRVADPRSRVHMVNVEQFEAVNACLVKLFEVLGRDFFTGFDVDLTGLLIDEVQRRITAEDFFGRDQQGFKAILGSLIGRARADLLAGWEHDFTGLGVNDVIERLLATPVFGDVRHDPARRRAAEGHCVVELMQNFFRRQAQGQQQRCHRQLALAVNTNVDDILGVKFKIEPRAAIWNDAGREEILARRVGLATVMVKQNTRRAVHLRHDNAFCAVDEEGAVLGHERHVAHVNVLLLDIEDRAGFRFGVDFKDDQAERDLHWRGVSDPALAAFFHVELGVFQFIGDKIELSRAGKVTDRENAAQRLFETGHIADRGIRPQKLLVRFALNLNQVGHFCHFVNVAEHFADALLGNRDCHVCLRCLLRHVDFLAFYVLNTGRDKTQKAASFRGENCSFQRLETSVDLCVRCTAQRHIISRSIKVGKAH